MQNAYTSSIDKTNTFRLAVVVVAKSVNLLIGRKMVFFQRYPSVGDTAPVVTVISLSRSQFFLPAADWEDLI